MGVTGNQPALAAYIEVTNEERMKITEAMMQQKVGASAKSAKMQREFRQDVAGVATEAATRTTILVKRARLAHGATVRWTRKNKTTTDQGDGRADPTAGNSEEVAYTSRMLACTRCESQQETSWMQLRTSEGFRAVHCRTCGKQERCLRNRCRCGTIWHQCVLHRVDPNEHTSRKAAVKTRQQKQEDQDEKQAAPRRKKSQRIEEAPVIEDGKATKNGSTSRKVLKEQQFCRKKAVDDQKINPTISNMFQRIKAREVEVDNQGTDEA